MPKRKPKFLLLKNLLTVAQASVGSKMFRRLFYRIGRRDIDVLEGGNLSCAFFVSSILKLFNLIGEIHTTVKETVKDMKRHGWREIEKPRAGAVVVYALKKFSGSVHRHIGIYVGNKKIISNRDFKKSPKIDRWNYRPVEQILWHPSLEK